MPNFDVYLETDAVVLGSTRTVGVPYPQNPVTSTDGMNAITTVAGALAASISEDVARGTYVAIPSNSAVRGTVSSFDHVPVFDNAASRVAETGAGKKSRSRRSSS